MRKPLFLALIGLFAFADPARAADYIFPIVAAGFIPGSSDQFYVTEFVITNPASQNVNGSLTLFSREGEPLDFGLRVVSGTGSVAGSTDSSFMISISGNGTWRAYLTDSGDLKPGWAILEMNGTVSPVALFSLNSKSSGLISQAAVFDSSPATRQRIFADTTRRSSAITEISDQTFSDTGIAIANPGGNTATVTLRVLSSNGQTVRSTIVTLEPLSSTSRFLKEFFPDLVAFQGTIEMQSNASVASLGLRFTGTNFTTLPVSIIE